MTRTEFDAAFKLALGYVISGKCYSFKSGNGTFCESRFRKNGVTFVFGEKITYFKYAELIDLIPDIKIQMGNYYVNGQFVSLKDNIWISFER